MKKLFFFLAIISVLFGGLSVFAGQMYIQNIGNATEVSPFLVNRNTTMYSHSFPVKSGDTFAIGYQAISSADLPNVTMYLEQSFQLPATEGSSDDNWTIPVSMTTIVENASNESLQYKAIVPIAMPYARVKIREYNNISDVNLTLKLGVIE